MTTLANEIFRQAELLSANEQLILAAKLIDQARKKAAAPAKQYKWLDVMGAAPYPLTGEDAQAWITRTRQEPDDVKT